MSIARIAQALLIVGIVIADLGALGFMAQPGGSKYFGLVLVGLAAATIGGASMLRTSYR